MVWSLLLSIHQGIGDTKMTKRKLEVWQQPIIFKDPRYITLTKAEHAEMTKDREHPLTWPKLEFHRSSNDHSMD